MDGTGSGSASAGSSRWIGSEERSSNDGSRTSCPCTPGAGSNAHLLARTHACTSPKVERLGVAPVLSFITNKGAPVALDPNLRCPIPDKVWRIFGSCESLISRVGSRVFQSGRKSSGWRKSCGPRVPSRSSLRRSPCPRLQFGDANVGKSFNRPIREMSLRQDCTMRVPACSVEFKGGRRLAAILPGLLTRTFRHTGTLGACLGNAPLCSFRFR